MKRKTITTYLALALPLISFARIGYTINSNWKFIRHDVPNAQALAIDDTKDWQIVNIPHSWNIDDTEDETTGYYRGIGWYQKSIQIDSIGTDSIYLRFEAANTTADVWVNGTTAGKQHRGGYTPFLYNATKLLKPGKNIIAVKVNNAFNEDIPPLNADFTFFGGLYRDVSIIKTASSHFDLYNGNGVFISTPNVSQKEAEILIISKAFLTKDKTSNMRVVHSIYDDNCNLVATAQAKAKHGTAQTFKLRIHQPRLWDIEDPYLYAVKSQLVDAKGRVIDEVQNPLGVRYYTFDAGKGFFLNGRHVKLIGASRHQDFKGKANAVPDEVQRNDIIMMKSAGLNCLRIAHYPHDESILEMCDKLGLVCFEECPIINKATQSPEFEENAKSQIREMIMRDYNHPCIIAWNSSNEMRDTFFDDQKERESYAKFLSGFLGRLNTYIHELDHTRPTEIVLCYEPDDNEKKGFHQADIVGYNKYFDWYEGKRNDYTTFEKRFHQVKPQTPFLYSEYGSGSDVWIHSFKPSLYDHSEEFQIAWYKDVLKQMENNDSIVGAIVWNFATFHSEGRNDDMVHNINDKSLVERDRRPKALYYYFKAHYGKEPFLSIPTKYWTKRGGREDSQSAGTCTQPVEVFANTANVELFLNGKSLGTQAVVDNSATFNVSFTSGENTLLLKSPSNPLLADMLKVDFNLEPYELASTHFSEIAINCGSDCFVNDESRNCYLWLPDVEYQIGYCGHKGGTYYRRDRNIYVAGLHVNGSNLDPVMRTQLLGLQSYNLDVANGQYEVTLLFADLQPQQENEFDVHINGDDVLPNLNIKQQYGAFREVESRFTISVHDGKGINVSFTTHKGNAFLNGIKVRRMF